mmetsp:Transcript_20963/g.55936  ORF Transcript_20963/g.55936 Transcript_20963/m.55936 type:complete len:211 (-) Transcript_20963:202-834(-)
MLSALSASVAGLSARSACTGIPCRPALARGRSYKMGFCIHSVSFDETADAADDRLPSGTRRPFVSVTVGDRSKETEMGDFCKDKEHWSFREVVTLESCVDEDVTIAVKVSQQYNLLIAALAMNTTVVCEVNFPMMSVLPRLKMEDRDVDGIVYASEPIRFDLSKDGRKMGRAYVTFETRNPPPRIGQVESSDPWCSLGGRRGRSAKEPPR